MCKTIETSINAFIVSFVTGIILLSSPQKIHKANGLILWSFCFIQLCDATIHYSIREKLPKLNLFVSKYLIPLILFSEAPIIYYATYQLTGKRMIWFEFLLIIYVIFGMLSHTHYCTKITSQSSPNDFLQWCQTTSYNWAKFLFLFFLIMAAYKYPNNIYKLVACIILITAFVANFNNASFGSGWCHQSNILAIIWLGMYLMDIPSKISIF